MKVAILAGGLGSRLAEETVSRPKPMVEIGGMPILWHIMKMFSSAGFDEFAIALGYRGEQIKKYMVDYCCLSGDVTVRSGDASYQTNNRPQDDWVVELVDTGQRTETGGRLRRLAPYLGDETFMLAAGDGVAELDFHDLLDFHRSHGRIATLTAVRPPARFGHIQMEGDLVTEFAEKPQMGEGWINGFFFVLEPEVFDYIDGDHTQFSEAPLERLAKDGQLAAYRHGGFWQCMDTVRDRNYLESLWEQQAAPWKVWD